MAMYLIGDIQGCDEPLQRLLDTLDFSASRDTLYALGDLVNRGPSSDAVLRRMMALGTSARCLLGNHDLHLLAAAHQVRKPHSKDTLQCILDAPDREAMLDWVRQQRLAMLEPVGTTQVLMVHAGVLPAWTAIKTIALAGELEAALRSPDYAEFLSAMYGNTPDAWSDTLSGADRLRAIVNALTRLRFCSPEGVMEFDSKEGAAAAPPGCMPWFDVPGRKTASLTVAFGHWSTLGWLHRTDVLSMDTGCVWGGCLSAVRLSSSETSNRLHSELIQVPCPQAQAPGAN